MSVSGVGGQGVGCQGAGRRRPPLPPCGHLEPQRVIAGELRSSCFGRLLEVFISAVDTLLFFFPVHFTFFSSRKGEVMGSLPNSTFCKNIFREEEVRIL